MMKIYALRCVNGIDDPKVYWTKDDWVGKNMGNPVSDFTDAELFTDKNDALRRKENLEALGCEFKLVSFKLVEIDNRETW